MSRDEVIETLRRIKPELKARFGIEKLALFGSFARNEATPSSDIDLAIVKIEKKISFCVWKQKGIWKKSWAKGWISDITMRSVPS